MACGGVSHGRRLVDEPSSPLSGHGRLQVQKPRFSAESIASWLASQILIMLSANANVNPLCFRKAPHYY